MPDGSRLQVLVHRLAAWAVAWVAAAAFYLLLIDITDLPELIVGAAAAVLAASGFELAREQSVLGAAISGRWLARAFRPVANVPRDIVLVCAVAVRQLASRQPARGRFRSAPFAPTGDEQREIGRQALAQSLGSFAPNTIIVGVDPERELILGHQLQPRGGRKALDVLELG